MPQEAVGPPHASHASHHNTQHTRTTVFLLPPRNEVVGGIGEGERIVMSPHEGTHARDAEAEGAGVVLNLLGGCVCVCVCVARGA